MTDGMKDIEEEKRKADREAKQSNETEVPRLRYKPDYNPNTSEINAMWNDEMGD